MEIRKICQSCSMPLDKPEMMGTEKDGSKSKTYCTYCYQNGAFINPQMSLEEMKKLVRTQMEKQQMDHVIVHRAVNLLPQLKRWKAAATAECTTAS